LPKSSRNQGLILIDASSGGNISHARIPVGPGYQVPFAERIKTRKRNYGPVLSVSLHWPDQAEQIIAAGQADIVLLAREMLRKSVTGLFLPRAN